VDRWHVDTNWEQRCEAGVTKERVEGGWGNELTKGGGEPELAGQVGSGSFANDGELIHGGHNGGKEGCKERWLKLELG
jgi:hypothetical protein